MRSGHTVAGREETQGEYEGRGRGTAPGNEKLNFERIREKNDEHHDQCVDGKRLDHRQSDDERCRDLSGYARVPCYSLACLAETDTLTDTGAEGGKTDGEAAARAA